MKFTNCKQFTLNRKEKEPTVAGSDNQKLSENF